MCYYFLPDSCKILPKFVDVIDHCRDEYNWHDDDTKPYYPGWIRLGSKENETALKELENPGPWVYQSSLKLKNAPYMGLIASYKGGGYPLTLRRSSSRTKRELAKIHQEDWLDLRTRAVFLEFTLYNPNINLFVSVVMLGEFMATGGASMKSDFKVLCLK